MGVQFTLKKVPNERTGNPEDALIKETTDDATGKVTESEQWCTVNELDRLFETCARRWPDNGWDLEKLMVAVNECDFD